jgi:hypothetical protein
VHADEEIDQSVRPFVLGGPVRWRIDRRAMPTLASISALVALIAVPVRGLYRATGASMEEGFMLVFPRLVQDGRTPNSDFLHLYGPTSLDVLALWLRVFGDSLESERTFGLLQTVGIIFAIYTLSRAFGHLSATGAAAIATFLILTPIGLTALAWHGGLALGLWALVLLLRASNGGPVTSYWWAGGLAGLALGFRPDLIVALGLAFGWLLWNRRQQIRIVVLGTTVGLLPVWFHLVRSGPIDAIDGMIIDPVFRLRPGRELPRPPTWGRIDGALQAVAESLPPWWRLPSPSASQQLFLWFWAVILIAIGIGYLALRSHRKSNESNHTRASTLLAAALFGVGVLPQALQRPDSTHLAWVAVVSWPLIVPTASLYLNNRLPQRHTAILSTGAVGLAMLAICPFFTFRTYLLHSRVSAGDLPVPFEIEREGRRFWVGDPAVARALNVALPRLAEISEPGDRLFVGPGDLSRTIYADTYIYWLMKELEPATYFIEMDPGLADAAGSGMAEDIVTADFVVLTNTWGGWTEPNDSSSHGSQEHNEAVAKNFCLVESYETNLVLLFERCEGGGGLNPADVAGRAPGIGAGGVNPEAGA